MDIFWGEKRLHFRERERDPILYPLLDDGFEKSSL